uniref:DUF11 domain-containing protein n=1 Tax=Candidatus Methanomethylicus mesodigestus TaxID=1867258 RepID=A0A7C3ILS1_9CREN
MRKGILSRGIVVLVLTPIIMMSFVGSAYPLWYKEFYVQGTVTTGTWQGACVEVSKTLNGSFTDPYTGKDKSTPTNLIHIGTGSTPKVITGSTDDMLGFVGEDPLCPVTPEEFPSLFQLIIIVKNCGETTLTNVQVSDRIGPGIGPKNASGGLIWTNVTNPSGFTKYFFTWLIGTLEPGNSVRLVIWLATEKNPAGAYEPTSGDKGDWQYLEVNGDMDHKTGARVDAYALDHVLTAVTSNITLRITDDGTPGNRIGVISSPVLPFTTSATAHYPP